MSVFVMCFKWIFLPDSTTRSKLTLPPRVKVDYRAACFCHRTLIDIGYICSVCLSSELSFVVSFLLVCESSVSGLQKPLKIWVCSFLKTEPTLNFANRKLGFRSLVFKKSNRLFLDGFYTFQSVKDTK